jgi:selenocysteine lyase/cysteine desulfurase
VSQRTSTALPVELVGDGISVPCVDGLDRPYLSLDAAASTSALPAVARRVEEFLPTYSSVHRGAGYKSQSSTRAYEDARDAALAFAGREGRDDIAILCRNTTEAINQLAYRLRFAPDDVVVTTVIEHHANLLPWRRLASCRYVECGPDGTFAPEDVERTLDAGRRPRLLAISGASNLTGWSPDLETIIDAAHERGVEVLVDGAQLAPHGPLPSRADYVAWSGHKMYAPFGTGVLVGPRRTFAEGDPFLAGGGAVDLVDLDEVVWSAPPEREEAGSPNVVGAVALQAAMEELAALGWRDIADHDCRLAGRLRGGLAAIEGVRLLGPSPGRRALPLATFTVEGLPHSLVAARLAAEFAIGVRHGCFCAHPYMVRLLGLTAAETEGFRAGIRRGDRRAIPGAVRASAGLSTSEEDVDRLLDAVRVIAGGAPPPVTYRQDPATGDYLPDLEGTDGGAVLAASCGPG